MKDLFDCDAQLSTNSTKGTKPCIVETYDYRDESSELLYQIVRYEPKDFRQRKPDGNGRWLWKLGDVRRVPYRLPELLESDRLHSVFVVEGEKDADRLAAMNLVSTCCAGGAEKWKTECNDFLKDRKVTQASDRESWHR